eukprot:1102378-Prymnesium_polylepis.1
MARLTYVRDKVVAGKWCLHVMGHEAPSLHVITNFGRILVINIRGRDGGGDAPAISNVHTTTPFRRTR